MTRFRGISCAALALVAALASAVPGSAVPPQRDLSGDAARGVVLVSLEPEAISQSLHRAMGATSWRRLDVPGRWELVRVPASRSLDGVVAGYRSLPGVRAAEPDRTARAATANDPCIWSPCAGTYQWNAAMIRATLAWELFPTMSAQQRLSADPVPVAILDSRIDSTHPDFANAGGASGDATFGGQIDWSRQRSWVDPTARSGSLAWHGTFVAGILGAAGGNATDVAGIAYPAMLLPYEVLDGSGRAASSAVAEAVTAAHRAGARVINLSLGLEGPSQIVRDAVVAATTGPRPALVVAAAGNNTRDEPFYPASYPETLSVAGVDATGAPAACSNYNDNVSVAAPARSVLSLAPMPARVRTIDCGTSAAAPHVSAVAALLFAQDPTRTPDEVRAILERTATDDAVRPGRDRHLGFGIVDADAALREGATATTDAVHADVPARGASTATVRAVARSPHGIRAAELYAGAPGSSDARFSMRPADGSWGGTIEELVGEVPLSDGSPAVRTLYVRAWDGAWGTTTTGVLRMDREQPRITNIRAGTVVRADGTKPALGFTLSDDTATRFVYTVTITGPDGVTTVWESGSRTAGAGAQSVYWQAPPVSAGPPGPHRIEIWAWDEAGNPSSASVLAMVL